MEAGTIDTSPRKGQEGSRWVNVRPTGEEVATWFEDNVTMHDDELQHDEYVQGITLIVQSIEEKEVLGFGDDGKPIIDKRENLVYVPYAKVETRVKYFWDYVRAIDGVGFIEPVPPPNPGGNLPLGFYRYSVQDRSNNTVNYVCCTMQATIYEKDSIEYVQSRNTKTGELEIRRKGKIIMQGAPGSKAVPVLGRNYPDNFALMKAETGAVGRALGLMGMLVVPGSGVATAEDVQEAQGMEGGPTAAAPPPTEVTLGDDDSALRTRIGDLVNELGALDAERLSRWRTWVREDRKITSLAEATSPQLRGLITKLETEIAEAKASGETS